MRRTDTIVLATLNRGKVAELSAILAAVRPGLGAEHIQVVGLADLVANTSQLQHAETGTTYLENAFNKAKLGYLATKLPTLADDTGLEVDALGGRPGLYSERYASPAPGETKDQANIRKLLEELKGVPPLKRTARFACTIALVLEGLTVTATGTLEGRILEQPRGKQGFGYDPVFFVDALNKTLAEVTTEEKNRLSHRAVAMGNLLKQLSEKQIALVAPERSI